MTTIERLRPGQSMKLNSGTTKTVDAWRSYRALGGEWVATIRFTDGDEILLPLNADIEVS